MSADTGSNIDGLEEKKWPTSTPSENARVPGIAKDEEALQPSEKPDLNKITWDGDHDPLNPRNWSTREKRLNLAIISSQAFTTPITSSMFAPGVTQVMEEFHSSSSIIRSFVVSVFVLGFAVGPLIVAPMSEIYGRRPVYIVSNFLFLIFTIACALSNSLGMLIAFRFLSGCVGSTPMTLGTASIGEMFPPDKRGGAMAVFGLGPLMGPVIGPIIGGFLAQAKGWRWTFWLLSILSGVILIIGTALLRETSTVILLENKTKTAIRETGNHGLVSALHDGLSVKEHFTRAIFRPLKMLFMTPIVLLLSTYVAIIFGYLYLFITTFPEVFQLQYGFATNITGLAYIGLGVGFLVGLVIMGTTTDPLHRKLKARNNGISKPEFRLPPLMITAPLLVTSFFWYGWSVEAKVHWIVPIIGTSFFSMGLMPAFVCTNLYLVDTYGIYAASATAATRVLQSLFGAFLPLAGPALYHRLGYGWGNSVLGFIALLMVPIPLLFFKYGAFLRTRFPVQL